MFDCRMAIALKMASTSLDEDVPIGCAIFLNNKLVAAAANRVNSLADPIAHAEVVAIRMASRALKTTKLNHCELFVTLEPCAMCASLISLSRIKKLYINAENKREGAILSGPMIYNFVSYRPEVFFFDSEYDCGLQSFFRNRRKQ